MRLDSKKSRQANFVRKSKGRYSVKQSFQLIVKILSSNILISLSFVAPEKASSRKATRFSTPLCRSVAQVVVSISLKDTKTLSVV